MLIRQLADSMTEFRKELNSYIFIYIFSSHQSAKIYKLCPGRNISIVKMFYIYFIQSQRNQKVYVGRTNEEPKIKVEEHNKG